MITALLKEKADEIKHKDFCTGGLNKHDQLQRPPAGLEGRRNVVHSGSKTV